MTAEPQGGEGNQVRLKLKGVPAGVARIEAWSGKDRTLAVEVGAGTAPFDDWIVYHIKVSMFANGNKGNDGEINGWKHPNYAGGDLQGVLERAAGAVAPTYGCAISPVISSSLTMAEITVMRTAAEAARREAAAACDQTKTAVNVPSFQPFGICTANCAYSGTVASKPSVNFAAFSSLMAMYGLRSRASCFSRSRPL